MSGGHNQAPKVYVENYEVVDRLPGEEIIIDEVTQMEIQGISNPRINNEIGERLTKKAVQFIEDNANRPFFMCLSTASVHLPLTPMESLVGTSDAGLYGDFIHEFDWTVGRVIDTLAERGLTDNTLIVVTSDNGGWRFSAVDSAHKPNGILRGQKFLIHEGGQRIPFVARWPGVIPPGTISEEPIGLVDLFDTVAEILDERLPENSAEDSISILPVLQGIQPDQPIHEGLIQYSATGKFAIRLGDWKYIPPTDTPFALFPDQFPEPEQLYNLKDDIREQNNLIDENPEMVSELNALLERLIDQGHTRPL